ncbi:MAG TPA: ATP-binding cassette domain-containing protein [Pirellulaceae bacterium]|nr:ATP-binding cassette domain-containing protein [Pirellulaceae bacterium]
MTAAIATRALSHRYGQRQALTELSLEIGAGEIFVFLGPNGGGKTTLFRLLSTLIPLASGDATVLGYDLRRQVQPIRERIGVVFQSPSLDRQLTVAENIRHQAALYGLFGGPLRKRLEEMLVHFGLRDRAHELALRLSGGLRRRVELAKGMIHQPQLLLLDEPSTGLDPGARSDLWNYLRQLRERGVTVVLTTHILEEGEQADRIAILSSGRLVALDSPAALKRSVGGDAITIDTDQPALLAREIGQRFSLTAQTIDGQVRLEVPDGHTWISRIVEAFPGRVAAIRLGKPTLEDVFIRCTGHRFWQQPEEVAT